MDFTSNRTPIDLDSNGPEINFEGWTLLESVIYDLWLSPCETYLVQHYRAVKKEDERLMKSAYNNDVQVQDWNLRQANRMGQIIGLKNWEYMIVHEFTNCVWYGNQDFPEDFDQFRADLKTAEIAWPTIRPGNLYRNPEGELRCIGPALAFTYQEQPKNLQFWGMLLTPEELRVASSLPLEAGHLDFRIWEDHRWGPAHL